MVILYIINPFRELTQQVADKINAEGGAAVAVQVDVANRENVFQAIQKTLDLCGDLHVVVNNAGIAPIMPIEAVTPEIYQKTMVLKKH